MMLNKKFIEKENGRILEEILVRLKKKQKKQKQKQKLLKRVML